MKCYAAAGHSVGKAGCEMVFDTSHRLATDLPRNAGGADTAPQPVELLIGALLGCETATAHFVARHLWPRPHNRISCIEWSKVRAQRDEQGALALPIDTTPQVGAGLTMVSGVATITPMSMPGIVSADQVRELGKLVETRCPVAAMMTSAGCRLHFDWRLAPVPSYR